MAVPYLVPAGYTLVLRETIAANGVGAAGACKVHIWVTSTDANVELPNTFDLSAWTAVQFIASGN